MWRLPSNSAPGSTPGRSGGGDRGMMAVPHGGDRPYVAISLATIPSRIAKIWPTLQSLLDGDCKPDKIFVNFPEYCVLQKSGYDIPDFLLDRDFCGDTIEISRSQRDWGPGTKLLGSVRKLPPHGIVIIADDDIEYDRRFASGLVAAQMRSPMNSFSYSVYRTSGLSVAMGCDGVSMWTQHLAGVEDFYGRYVEGTELVYHDDIWINFFLATKGVTAVGLPVPRDTPLIYKQLLANDVLMDLDGNLARERITRKHMPRLMRSGLLPFSTRLRYGVRGAIDRSTDLARRAVAKAIRVTRKTLKATSA